MGLLEPGPGGCAARRGFPRTLRPGPLRAFRIGCLPFGNRPAASCQSCRSIRRPPGTADRDFRDESWSGCSVEGSHSVVRAVPRLEPPAFRERRGPKACAVRDGVVRKGETTRCFSGSEMTSVPVAACRFRPSLSRVDPTEVSVAEACRRGKCCPQLGAGSRRKSSLQISANRWRSVGPLLLGRAEARPSERGGIPGSSPLVRIRGFGYLGVRSGRTRAFIPAALGAENSEAVPNPQAAGAELSAQRCGLPLAWESGSPRRRAGVRE